jgi:AcrR family transcriptional regulator
VAESVRLRADAQRNRDTLLTAARAAFAEHGLEAPLDEIAKRAGVGSGTLYRHFPTREDLITAVFAERVAENVAQLERARQHDDPWAGLADYIRQTCRTLATDRGLADLFAAGAPDPELRALNSRAYDGLTALTERAKASGTLRADFTPEDIILLLEAIAGIIRQTGTAAPLATDRFVALALDGFRAEAATPAPPPITRRQIRAGRRDSRRKRSGNARTHPSAGRPRIERA